MWLTETGGIVKFEPELPEQARLGPDARGEGAQLHVRTSAALQSQIKRLYIYDWTGGTSSTRFDAGLMNAHDQPRPGYVVVCKAAARGEMQRQEVAKN